MKISDTNCYELIGLLEAGFTIKHAHIVYKYENKQYKISVDNSEFLNVTKTFILASFDIIRESNIPIYAAK